MKQFDIAKGPLSNDSPRLSLNLYHKWALGLFIGAFICELLMVIYHLNYDWPTMSLTGIRERMTITYTASWFFLIFAVISTVVGDRRAIPRTQWSSFILYLMSLGFLVKKCAMLLWGQGIYWTYWNYWID